ncbi:hypothetical protein NEUTE1DRAFT_147629 [Neurospora tetrasperma FGSC 2508]|uniref:Uncharacterized protein n=1 Tax=Neurospora tetrasperma (strain FGSC 2508 / ATCC MYA-4615 / P0657) TaxID=510951 RepID=F8MRW7_NEUT8|nr:uncharacterized protein NEUTE1DRAFT_147629 [Neurospora tetrasperma FGSC 2508]EGO54961.1 hypothetical protein NEUTE1DRAFT_147629 [Neurospora tetrasperma FGSC 2508]EGZ69848.1 hypothetical protein NEUTE2DRAFT_141357 [Neurospora tetrasperma FGSC 2509]
MDPYPYPSDIPIAMRPLTGTMTPGNANSIMILSTALVCIIGGLIIGAILISTVPPNLPGDMDTLSPMAVTMTKTLLSTIVLVAIIGTVIAGVIIWRRQAGYDGCGRFLKCHKRFGKTPEDHEDLEANRGSSSTPSRVHVHPYHSYDYHDPYYSAAYEIAQGSDFYDSDSSESFIYDPEPSPSGPYQQYPRHEAHSSMHNTSRDDHSSNSDGPVSYRYWGLDRATQTSDHFDRATQTSDRSSDSDSYMSDLYDNDYEADSESSLSSPPTPSDRAPLLQTTRRGPRYS